MLLVKKGGSRPHGEAEKRRTICRHMDTGLSDFASRLSEAFHRDGLAGTAGGSAPAGRAVWACAKKRQKGSGN